MHDALLTFHRTKLIGLSALTGAVASEALYTTASQFKPQANIIMSAMLAILFSIPIDTLDDEYVLLHLSLSRALMSAF
jgi:hypothetical protein